MPAHSSISRDRDGDRDGAEDSAACSSILGKRERALGEDATIQPDAKRPATQAPPPAKRLDGKDGNVSSSSSSASPSDVDEPEGLEADSRAKARPSGGTSTFCALPKLYIGFWLSSIGQPSLNMATGAFVVFGSRC